MWSTTLAGDSRAIRRSVLAVALATAASSADAWVFPEHRDLALMAVEQLNERRRAVFDGLWSEARLGDQRQLCAQGADTGQSTAPSCIDWAALTAIAGDHACSSTTMFDTARSAGWILQVADVAAQLKVDLARIPVTMPVETISGSNDVVSDARRRIASAGARAERVNALRTADIRLQRADPEYATRAGANNAHFLLARPETGTGLNAYAALTLKAGSEISAIGSYAYFHLSALQKASRLAREPLGTAQRRQLARAAMADEAFALHFLQDVYAAGHIAGTWGDASQRQGTHDFYNQNGLEVFTWSGGSRSVVLMGDAHIRPEDTQIAASAVRESLEQVLDVAAAQGQGADFPYTPAAPPEPEAFDVCRNNQLPARAEGLRPEPGHVPYFARTVAQTPVPSLGPGLGAMPRFRSELGPFVGLAATLDGRMLDGGFVQSQNNRGASIGLDLSFRTGFGLDGVMGEGGDGLVYGSIGLRSDAPSTNKFNDASRGSFGGNLSAAVPARLGWSTRLRMPFYLVPGDLLLLSPLYWAAPDTYKNMAVTAGNGGLLPWQAGWATPIGRFQFVLGREVGVTLYGRSGNDQLIAPSATPGGLARVVSFKSLSYDLPIMEYRPFRSFSSNQSSSVVFQWFAALDRPFGAKVDYPQGEPVPALRSVWSTGVRLVFDWRYYY